MSVIPPEDLLGEVRPWDENSWKNFVQKYVVPIGRLAKATVTNFAGDPSADAAQKVRKCAEEIIKVSKEKLGEFKVEYGVPEDPVEVLARLLEISANTFLGVNDGGKYTLFAWTLRKITKEYLKVLYEELAINEEKRKKVFELLGVKELFKPPVKSKLAEDLTMIGYPDYLSYVKATSYGYTVTVTILPYREPTLGGTLCRFVDGLVLLLSRPGILSGIELSADVVKLYFGKCKEVAAVPSVMEKYKVEVRWDRFYGVGSLSMTYIYVVEGFGIKVVGSFDEDGRYGDIREETNFLTFMRELSPSLATWTELLISVDGKFICPLVRVL